MRTFILIFFVCSVHCINGFEGMMEEGDFQGMPLAAVWQGKADFLQHSFQEFVQQHQKKATPSSSTIIRTQKEQEALDKKLLEVAEYYVEPDMHNTMIQTLLGMGASVNCITEKNELHEDRTALWKVVHEHCYSRDLSASIQTLITAGAPIEPSLLEQVMTTSSMDIKKRLAAVTMLLKAKVNVNAKNPVSLWNVLMWNDNAVQSLAHFYLEENVACGIFRLFMEHADPKPDFNDNALEVALKNRRFLLAAYFIAAGAPWEHIEEAYSERVLHEAYEYRRDLMNLNIMQQNIQAAHQLY